MGYENGFIVVPKDLIFSQKYKSLSGTAKLIYIVLKDRMNLSIKNGYTDDSGNPCVVYTHDSLSDVLNWSKQTISKAMNELVSFGLISRYQRNGCKPDFIYVKEVADAKPAEQGKEMVESEENKESKVGESSGYKEVSKVDESRDYNELSEDEKVSVDNSTDSYSKVCGDNSDYDFSGFPDITEASAVFESSDCTDYTDEIRGKIDYDMLLKVGNRKEELDMFVSTVNDVLKSGQRAMRICGETYPIKVVKERFRDIDRGTFEYVSEILSRNKGEIRNIRAYVISLIFNEKSKNDVFFTQTTDEEIRAREIKEARKAELERKMEELINKGPPKFEKRRT